MPIPHLVYIAGTYSKDAALHSTKTGWGELDRES